MMMMRAPMILGLLTSKMYQGHLKFIIYLRKHAEVRSKLILCLLLLVECRTNRLRDAAYLMI